jgi:excisionase family DNA binding protein
MKKDYMELIKAFEKHYNGGKFRLPQYYTIDEVSEMLGTSHVVVKQLRDDGILKAYQVAKRTVRFKLEDIAAYQETYGDMESAKEARKHV